MKKLWNFIIISLFGLFNIVILNLVNSFFAVGIGGQPSLGNLYPFPTRRWMLSVNEILYLGIILNVIYWVLYFVVYNYLINRKRFNLAIFMLVFFNSITYFVLLTVSEEFWR